MPANGIGGPRGFATLQSPDWGSFLLFYELPTLAGLFEKCHGNRSQQQTQ